MKDAGDSSKPPRQANSTLTKPRAVGERYGEQIVEDIVYDVVDEVAFWMQDGGKVVDRSGKDDKVSGLVPGGREEIKELVQDD
jgi:COMPASS component BRE2